MTKNGCSSKIGTDRNIDSLLYFLWTHQLNIAIFVVVDLPASHLPLKRYCLLVTIIPYTQYLQLHWNHSIKVANRTHIEQDPNSTSDPGSENNLNHSWNHVMSAWLLGWYLECRRSHVSCQSSVAADYEHMSRCCG